MRQTLYFFIFLLFISTSLSSCGPTSKKGAWIPEDKKKFLSYCREARQSDKLQLSENQITAVCDCALNKAVAAYESFHKANADSIKLVGDSCFERIKGR